MNALTKDTVEDLSGDKRIGLMRGGEVVARLARELLLYPSLTIQHHVRLYHKQQLGYNQLFIADDSANVGSAIAFQLRP